MLHALKRPVRPPVRRRRGLHPSPELIIDLEADNVLLRAALAKSIDEGVARDLVLHELKHRIGNVLAVVQAIARQTFRKADPASVADFSGRLLALAAAQKLLIDTETAPALLANVVKGAVVAHCAEGDRCVAKGPVVALDGRRAHALTLALHELATNAAKYGSLSVETGWVETTWTIDGDQLNFLWREHGGPAVSAPKRTGFGSVLITRNLGVAFAGEVDLKFPANGVECRLRAPYPFAAK